jgi:uncharacterized membrane protein
VNFWAAWARPRNQRLAYHPNWLIPCAVIITGAVALRSYHLDTKDLWVDEAHPWWFASLPLLDSIGLGLSGGPINSGADPLYNVILHFWIKATGDTLFGLRLLSVLLNTLGVAYLGRIAGRLGGLRAWLTGLIVGSLAPLWVFYSQEIRPYAFI